MNDWRGKLLDQLGDICLQQWEASHMVDYLNQSIYAYQDALRDDPENATYLQDLGTALYHRSLQLGDVTNSIEAVSSFDQLADLEKSIGFYRQSLKLRPGSHPNQSNSLNNLANALLMRFEQIGQLADLEESIAFHRQALELVSGSRSGSLNNLANALLKRFEQIGQLADLEESIAFHRRALELRPRSHPNRSSSLDNLASALWTQFEQTGQLADLKESIAFHRQALELRPGSHPNRSRSLDNLASALWTRFEQTGQLADLEESIAFHRQALEPFPGSHPNQSGSLNNLASALSTQFEQTGQLTDLEESITFHRQALGLRLGSHPDRSGSLNNLASTLLTRFEQTGQLADLEESIAFHRQALELRPRSHPDRSGPLSNFANALLKRFEQIAFPWISLQPIWPAQQPRKCILKRFEQIGQLADLEESIAFHRQALELFLGSHPNRSISLNNLASALSTQFQQTGQLADLEESIAFHRQALELRPGSHPKRSGSLDNLASALLTRFEQTGQLADLEESIAFHGQALELRPRSHPNRSGPLSNLANALLKQFEQIGQLADLEQSIAFHVQALELFPGSHCNQSGPLNNLANALLKRFEQIGQLADLEESIAFHRQALELRPGSHPNRSTLLANLASALLTQFEQTGQLADLEESIAFHRQALELRPGSHPTRSTSLDHLASALLRRFEQTGQLADLEESIAFHRQALELRPESHHSRSASLVNLANTLLTRFEETSKLADIDESMICFRGASAHATSSVITRFRHSRHWARKAAFFRHSSAMEAYQYLINLLPHLASLDLNIQQRQEALSRARGLACDACSYAIQEGQFDKAVEFLCAGRGVFWAQALQLRTPMDELHFVAPHLALKLWTISNVLEAPSTHDGSQPMQDGLQHTRDLEQEATRRRILNNDWNDTVEAVRKLKDFDDFMLPKSISKLREASSNGPVVMLNAANSGCDALLVTQTEVKHIPLLDLSIKTTLHLGRIIQMALSLHGAPSDTLEALLQPMHTNPRLKAVRISTSSHTSNDIFAVVLGMLWFTVARPVIDALNLKVKQEDKDIPTRIWWCPTGSFALLPIHAAGVYEGDNPESLSDYAISSYTPTLDTLLASPCPKVHEPKMLAVAQAEMPGTPASARPRWCAVVPPRIEMVPPSCLGAQRADLGDIRMREVRAQAHTRERTPLQAPVGAPSVGVVLPCIRTTPQPCQCTQLVSFRHMHSEELGARRRRTREHLTPPFVRCASRSCHRVSGLGQRRRLTGWGIVFRAVLDGVHAVRRSALEWAYRQQVGAARTLDDIARRAGA
ncbi:hypothetical protein GGX14DRAFT_555471 [Mycena pura]|uniref:TPR-like protein n=1 Tax=Mycena pura TaxID=153505 RepID=A0AAD7E4B6_9AGAR|nr:hypothetical protein GGX14DRAFT_555471 [Mycena pura]